MTWDLAREGALRDAVAKGIPYHVALHVLSSDPPGSMADMEAEAKRFATTKEEKTDER